MKVVLCWILVLWANMVQSDKIDCEVVSFEAEDGTYGTCCVLHRGNMPVPKEQIIKELSPAEQTSSNDGILKNGKNPKIEPKGNTAAVVPFNFVDSPPVCAEGTLRDHNGDCIVPF